MIIKAINRAIVKTMINLLFHILKGISRKFESSFIMILYFDSNLKFFLKKENTILLYIFYKKDSIRFLYLSL